MRSQVALYCAMWLAMWMSHLESTNIVIIQITLN